MAFIKTYDPDVIYSKSMSGVTLGGRTGTEFRETWCPCFSEFRVLNIDDDNIRDMVMLAVQKLHLETVEDAFGDCGLKRDYTENKFHDSIDELRYFTSRKYGARELLLDPKLAECSIYTFAELPQWAKQIIKEETNGERLKFSDNALNLMRKRYLRKVPEGYDHNLLDQVTDGIYESSEMMFYRIAIACAGVYRLRLFDTLCFTCPETQKSIEKPIGCLCSIVDKGYTELSTIYQTVEKLIRIEKTVFDYAQRFFREMVSMRVIPAGRTLRSIGAKKPAVGNCAVLDLVPDALSNQKIFSAAIDIQRRGGGVGFPFQLVEPGEVDNCNIGPVGVLKMASEMMSCVTQDGRKAANMGVMHIEHPDILEFISCKTKDENELTNFNISVGMSDQFMEDVIKNPNKKWTGKVNGKHYDKLHLIERSKKSRSAGGGKTITNITEVEKSVGYVFDEIAKCAKVFGEPGIVFLDRFNEKEMSGIPINATNPCGEEGVVNGDVCCIANINFHKFLKKDYFWSREKVSEFTFNFGLNYQKTAVENGENVTISNDAPGFKDGISLANGGSEELDFLSDAPMIDKSLIISSTKSCVELLDAVCSLYDYPESVPGYEHRWGLRRIGAGQMGMASLLYELKVPYDSEKGRSIISKIAKLIEKVRNKTTRDLARQFGSFPLISNSKYKEKYVRNVGTGTCPPTGSVSWIPNCSSGCEPLFSIAYEQKAILDGNTSLCFINDIFFGAMKEIAIKTWCSLPHLLRLWPIEEHESYNEEVMVAVRRQKLLDLFYTIKQNVVETGNLSSIRNLDKDDLRRKFFPEEFFSVFVTAMDISPMDHLLMVTDLQRYIDNAISKTVNLPSNATVEDIKNVWINAYLKGSKGLTVYVDKSREVQILNTGISSDETKLVIPDDQHVSSYNEESSGCASTISSNTNSETDELIGDENVWVRGSVPVIPSLSDFSDVSIYNSYEPETAPNNYEFEDVLSTKRSENVKCYSPCIIPNCDGQMIQMSFSCVSCTKCFTETCNISKYNSPMVQLSVSK